ncbi:unnamed protein product [Wuchereria bancrofti]|uniref:EGF-like domain-containing protein n=1 Tax=Wuchereria bancrofti TaxID=6293 RepID=A0A3P7EJK4_WUCBA|nr:unnamed protein product [Wuchereria bancrofti]
MKPGYMIGPSGKCQPRGSCQPYLPNACDQRRNEECLPDDHGGFMCQCATNQNLVNECTAGTHDCDQNANCIDTDEGYICTCKDGYIDESPDQARKPGRVCRKRIDECLEGMHNCSENAVCINLPKGFLCRCKENYVDFSPNPQHFGGTNCKPIINECADDSLNNCNNNAICIDTMDGYKCQCKDGFIDRDELRNPGRICQKVISVILAKKNLSTSCIGYISQGDLVNKLYWLY